MKYTLYIFIISLLLGFVCAANAQQQPAPKQAVKPAANPKPKVETQKILVRKKAVNRRFDELRGDGDRWGGFFNPLRIQGQARNYLKQLYRKPTSEELKSIAPDEEDLQKYAQFLTNQDTGLIKLINDAECSENSKIVVASADCLKYKFPGAGSSFSFRINNYRLPRLADLTFTENSFQATGNHLHGIFVNIGDVPLENVNFNTRGLKFLLEFKPSTEFQTAKEVDQILSIGIVDDGFIYRRALYAEEDTTFVLRSIAYGGKSYRAVEGVTYNELDFDRRRDVIVAFRIVRKYADGSISLLWKKLSDEKAPKLSRK